ncbi:N-terminal cleavage protein [Burkholderia pyrrocinia]|nr:N-terminal cleavage protein [Burkholderia pyrrocinia]
MRGASLIEATVAVALLAMITLSVAGSQLTMMRAQRTTIWRERALWLADARVELAHAAPGAEAGMTALTAASLPGGAMTIDGGAGSVRLAIVGWRDGDAASPMQCGAAEVSARPPSCVRIPFREVTDDGH